MYNNYDNRRGGYGGGYRRDNGYRNNYDRGYGYQQQPNPGYQPQSNPFENNGEFPFDIGQVVIHKTTGEELTVIKFGREQLECRLPNLTSGWFYIHELEAKDGNKK